MRLRFKSAPPIFSKSAVAALVAAVVAASSIPAYAATYRLQQYVPGIREGVTTCTTPWGETIAVGSTVKAFQSAMASAGQACQAEQRSCTASGLSGAYQYAQCTEQPVLAASDGTTVTSKVSATEFNLSNTSGQAHPANVAVGAVLKGGLATPECKGDFTLTFKASKLGGDQGFLGLTVVSGSGANQVSAGYKSLVEQAMYNGNYLLRRMVNYDYRGFGAGPVAYQLSRTGDVVAGTVGGVMTEAVTLTSPPATLRGFVYFVKDAGMFAAQVSLTEVQFSCLGG